MPAPSDRRFQKQKQRASKNRSSRSQERKQRAPKSGSGGLTLAMLREGAEPLTNQ